MRDGKLKTMSGVAEIMLRDLEGLLREKLGNGVVVDSFTTSYLTALGEHYGSTMLRVDVVVKRDGQSSEPEELFLVAKTVAVVESFRTLINAQLSFDKEIYMFEKIIPAYRDLERECGVPEAEVFDPLPKLFGARLSMEDAKDKFDDDAVILMQNLTVKNYACANKKIGCDLAHARMVVVALARFHAIGIGVRLKKPELFQEFKTRAKPVGSLYEHFTRPNEFIRINLKKTPALLPYLPRVEEVLLRSAVDYYKLNALVEPWETISHADFWITNMMFLDDANGNPKDVKFIDFQAYLCQNPMRDLVDFLITGCGMQVRTRHIEALCDLYYESLTSHLARLHCDVDSFSRDSFDKLFAIAANLEFVRCLFFCRLLTLDAEIDPVHDPMLILQTEPSKECVEWMTEITLKFANENWI